MELTENGSVRIKLPSADSFDEDLSDVDDEVFIKSSKNGYRRVPTDKHLKRPLMAPRRKSRKGQSNGHSNGSTPVEIQTASPKGCPFIITFLYAVIGIGALAGIAGLVAFLSRSHIFTLIKKISVWNASDQGLVQFAHCDTFEVESLWNVTLPYTFYEESRAVFFLDINGDQVEDLILASSTGAGKSSSPFLCELSLNASVESCAGRIVALDGRNGSVLWTTYLEETAAEVACKADFNLDGLIDCLVVGKTQFVWAISGSNGRSLWQTTIRSVQPGCVYSPLPTPQIINDVNGDKVLDVLVGLNVAGQDCAGHVGLLNGQSGKLLELLPVPGSQQLAFSPVLKSSGDGSDSLLLICATSNKDKHNVYSVPVSAFVAGKNDATNLVWNNTNKITGLMMVDINNDGMEDLIAAFANNSVSAICGLSWKVLWNATLQGKFLSFQAAANLNRDSFLDVAVRISVNHNGTSLSSIHVLDGTNGQLFLNYPPRKQFWPTISSSLKMEGFGQDIVLDWTRDSLEGKLLNRLSGFSSHGELPGLLVYESSEELPRSSQIASLEELLRLLKQREDLRVAYSHSVRRSQVKYQQPGTLEPAPNLEEAEPKMIGYPSQHGVRKHGRWNVPKASPFEDYTETDYAPPQPENYYDNEEADYGPAASYYYKNQQPMRKTYPATKKRGRKLQVTQQRGKRETPQPAPVQSINFSPVLLNSAAEIPGSIDVLFATQWTYPAIENTYNRIASCVGQHISRGGAGEESSIFESILECSDSVNKDTATPDLIATVKEWLEPLGMRYGAMTLSRSRLRCRCHHETRYTGKPCSRIEPLYVAKPVRILP